MRNAVLVAAVPVILPLAALLASACGGDSEPSSRETSTGGDPALDGKRLVEQRGCLSCHSADGRASPGPTWKGLAGSQVKLADGRTVTADGEYLLRAILDPDADTVEGFEPGLMAGAMPKPLTGAEAQAVVRYLQGL